MRTFLRRSRRALLLVVAAAVLAVTVTSTAAGAATVHHKPTTKPVPTCPSLGRVHTGVHSWMDAYQGTRSPLFVNLDKMICSAADRSRIELKSWFVSGTGPATTRLATHLSLMHRYHHVSVVILVGRNGYPAAAYKSWNPFVKRFRAFAAIRSCARRCTLPTTGGISHSKFVTVSKMRSGGAGVLSTSANFTDQQFATVEHGIFVAGDTGLYNAFHARFAAMAAHTAKINNGSWVAHRYGVSAYFSPTAAKTDPDHAELSAVDCRRHGLVEVTSLRLNSTPVITDLVRLRAQGCTVRVIIEHTSKVNRTTLSRRCGYDHDKSILIDTPTRKEVIAGSEDFSWGGLHGNDQQMLRVRNGTVLGAFERQFAKVWKRPSACLAP